MATDINYENELWCDNCNARIEAAYVDFTGGGAAMNLLYPYRGNAVDAPKQQATMTYATGGKCHNAEPGTFNHECGRPATWVGTHSNGFKSGYCDDYKACCYEARDVRIWEKRNG